MANGYISVKCVNMCSLLCSLFLSVGYLFLNADIPSMSTADQKLDKLKELFASSIAALKQSHAESIAALKESHKENCKVMGGKLNKLEEDLEPSRKGKSAH